MEANTAFLIQSALKKSRDRYPNNERMLSALLAEVAELVEEQQSEHRDIEKVNAEAADCIAVLIRIIEEDDASICPAMHNKNLESPAAKRIHLDRISAQEKNDEHDRTSNPLHA